MGYDSNDFDDGSIERCPCCGGQADVECWTLPIINSPTYYYVKCGSCGLMTRPYGESTAAAITDWNRRTAWEDYAGNPDYDPRREDHRGGLQPSSIIRNLRECGDGDCRGCSLIILRYAGCQNRLMLAAADTIEHLMERERRRKQT